MALKEVLLAAVCLISAINFASGDRAADEELVKWEAPEELTKAFPYFLAGMDDDGAEIWLNEQGKWDAREVVEAGGKRLEDFRKYIRQMFTRVAFKNRDEDNSKHAVVILDMDGLTHDRAFHVKTLVESLSLLKTFVEFIRAGGIKKAYVVNSNAVFETVLLMIKPVLGELSQLIEIYGTNKEQWIPKLLKQLPKDQLPPSLGGDKDHKFLATFG